MSLFISLLIIFLIDYYYYIALAFIEVILYCKITALAHYYNYYNLDDNHHYCKKEKKTSHTCCCARYLPVRRLSRILCWFRSPIMFHISSRTNTHQTWIIISKSEDLLWTTVDFNINKINCTIKVIFIIIKQ